MAAALQPLRQTLSEIGRTINSGRVGLAGQNYTHGALSWILDS